MKILVFVLLIGVHLSLSAQLKISVTGLRNNSETELLGFYLTDKSFEDETPLFSKTESKASTKDHVLTIT